jgi:hypothetical protein
VERVLDEQVRRTWDRVVERFASENEPLVRTAPSPEPADIRTAWAACVASVRELLAAHYGLAAIEQRFEVPEDYSAFMQAVGGGWQWPHGLEWSVFDAATVAESTANDFDSFVLGAEEDEPLLDSGFWLGIGRYSDKHWYLLCCDRTHGYFGAVVDGHDSHPWLNGVEFGCCWRMAESFLAWLEMHAKPAAPGTSERVGE